MFFTRLIYDVFPKGSFRPMKTPDALKQKLSKIVKLT